MKPLIFSVLLALLILPALGTEVPVEQTTCPVMVGNPIDRSLYVDHEGRRVYFCCKQCKGLFQADPGAYLKNLPQPDAEEHAQNHNHATDHQAADQAPKWVSYLGKFHPLIIHLPIALILAAALAELIYMLSWNILFRNTALFNLSIAALGGATALPPGFAAASGADYPAAYAQVLLLHKTFGIAVLLAATAATALGLRANRKSAGRREQLPYRLALTCVGLVALTGHLGGQLVYGLNYFSWN